jgi:hypothetical protein
MVLTSSQGKETNFGLQYDSFKIPRGDFNIVEHSLFNAYGVGSTWMKMAIILDLASFQHGLHARS